MPDLFSCILLGFVQGLTEFLPVSSSAHLVFFQKMLGWEEPDVFFDVLLHLGTLFSVVIYLRRETADLLKKPRVALNIALGTAVTALIVFPFKDSIESFFANVTATAIFLLITGIFLFAAEWFLKKFATAATYENMNPLKAALIGLAQGIAVLPGISRSGATISAGIFMGIRKTEAAKFSFLLSIPIILGAALIKFKDADFQFSALNINYAAGMAAAFISGLFAVYVMTQLLNRIKLYWFAGYCWIIGLLVILL